MSGCGCGGAGAPASACGCAVGDGSIPGRDDPGRAERRAWCGTGAKDDGKLFPATPASAPVLPPGTSLRLTPFGAYAAEPGAPAGLATFEVADRYRIAHRAGFTGRLVPSGPNVLQPDPTTALEPSGSVFPPTAHEMAAFVPREQWAQLPTTLRAAARARGFQPQREFHPAAGLLLPEGAEPLLAHLADLRTLDTTSSPPAAVKDPCTCEGTYECALAEKVVLDYLGFRLCVPEAWFWKHYEADSWISRSDTLDVLWAAVSGTGTGVSGDDLDGLIGCWMIDTAKDTHGRSYSMFFEDGNAPRKFLRYMLDLVRRFSHEIKDDWSGTTTCAGLRDYIEDVLGGQKGSSLADGVGPCTIKFRATSQSSTLPAVKTSRSCGGASEEVSCGNPSGMGGDFQDWQQVMYLRFKQYEVGGNAYIHTLGVESGLAAPWSAPDADWLGYATINSGAVAVPANRLTFRGYQLDFTLFWARVALDYAYQFLRWDFLFGAWVYARGALSEMVEYGRTWVHELGHVHMGQGGHCEGTEGLETRCCFDIAAEHWKCRVASTLGLPDLSTLSCTPDPLTHSLRNPCGGEGDEYPLVCDRVALCAPQTDAGFLAGPCS